MKKHTFGILILTITLMVIVHQTVSGAGLPSGLRPNINTNPENPYTTGPVSAALTYQGQLIDEGYLADGQYDFEFSLYDAATAGNQVGSTVAASNVSVSAGLFTVVLDFGTDFDGTALWLEIGVRPGNTGPYETLNPRQALTAAPYASYASSAPWSGLDGIPGDFADGVDDDTMYTAGTGLSLNGNTFELATAYQLPQGCTNKQIARWDGTGNFWTCANQAAYTAGDGLYLAGNQFNVDFDGSGSATSVAHSDHDHLGQSWSTSSGVIGLRVTHAATTGSSVGLRGQSGSDTGTGVFGYTTALSGYNTGVMGRSDSENGRGVHGRATSVAGSGSGVVGESWSAQGRGVYGYTSHASGVNYGVYGFTNSSSGYAGYFYGDVQVTGNLSKGGGSFKIDHPLNPENKYLYHSFVESPDMLNIYNGNVTLDENGEAWIELPEWFEALNRTFRYQLTPIGAPGPNLHIAVEIEALRFKIAGGSPGMKVSWQVTGIRHDPYAEAHRIPVVEEKLAEEKGTYLHPLEWGMPQEHGLDYQRNQRWLGEAE